MAKNVKHVNNSPAGKFLAERASLEVKRRGTLAQWLALWTTSRGPFDASEDDAFMYTVEGDLYWKTKNGNRLVGCIAALASEPSTYTEHTHSVSCTYCRAMSWSEVFQNTALFRALVTARASLLPAVHTTRFRNDDPAAFVDSELVELRAASINEALASDEFPVKTKHTRKELREAVEAKHKQQQVSIGKVVHLQLAIMTLSMASSVCSDMNITQIVDSPLTRALAELNLRRSAYQMIVDDNGRSGGYNSWYHAPQAAHLAELSGIADFNLRELECVNKVYAEQAESLHETIIKARPEWDLSPYASHSLERISVTDINSVDINASYSRHTKSHTALAMVHHTQAALASAFLSLMNVELNKEERMNQYAEQMDMLGVFR